MIDETGGFPHHAHLCCLPLNLDLDPLLARQYVQRSLSGLHELPIAARNNPYVYVECPDARGSYKQKVYLARSDDGRVELEHKRLKPTIAALLGLSERGDWRAYPGDRELEKALQRFAAFRREREPWVPSKARALPHGRATEQAEAQDSSPRVSKGSASAQ
ncbi:MAG: hypothetical protein L0387_28675 [Acidobacteria bacterium]|nr:hypothetical protein [Acidobacteriota bacterium]MCI0720966.1 hypothetical protein [Acidobacteriota bacterium]